MTSLHIFTAPKGGVGKTILAISCLWALRDWPSDAVGLDLNSMNYDLWNLTVRHRGNPDHVSRCTLQHPDPSPTTSPRHKLLDDLDEEFSSFFVLHPPLGIPDYHIYRRTNGFRPFVGAREFWRRIVLITSTHPRYNVVTDTNSHLATLIDEVKSQRVQTAYEIRQISSLFDNVYIWFVWTPAAIRNNDDGLAGALALEELENLFNGKPIIPIHVLNPVAYLPAVRGFSAFMQRFVFGSTEDMYRISPLADLATKRTGNPMGFSEFYKLARETIPPPDSYSLLEDIFAGFSDALSGQNGRPWNVFAIPFFYLDLHGSVEQFGDNTLARQMDALEKLEKIISAYLRARIGQAALRNV